MKENLKEWLIGFLSMHRTEVAFAGVSCLCSVVAVVMFYGSSGEAHEAIVVGAADRQSGGDAKRAGMVERAAQVEAPSDVQADAKKIFVDVSGAVLYPGVLELNLGDRLSEAVDKAGGLSVQADTDFYARNYNASRILYDQEKIYIPRVDEVAQGVFIEGRYIINHSLEKLSTKSESSQMVEGSDDLLSDGNSEEPATDKVNINSATEAELDTLPGVGSATAKKIIGKRPYASLDELLEKKVLSQGTYDKIIDLVIVN